MKTNINLLSLIILCFSLLFFPKAIYAVDNLVINEFSSGTTSDWIELYNAGTEEVDLAKYKFLDSENHEKDFGDKKLGAGLFKIITLGSLLNKDGDGVKLVIKESGSIVEEVFYGTGKGLPAPTETQSISKDKDGIGNFILNNNPTMGFSNCDPTCPAPISTNAPTPSPTSKPTSVPTSIPTKTPIPTPEVGVNSIYITEVYPSPLDGEYEWVEIVNSNDFKVDLDGWYFKDSKSNKITISDREIAGNSRVYIENDKENGQILNNDGDTVFLMNLDNNAINSLSNSYPEIPKGKSWVKVGDKWCITTPSPGNDNSQCQDQTTATITPTNTPKPSVKASSTPRPSPKETLESQILNDDSNSRQLPVLGDQDINIQASESGSTPKTSSKLLLPLGIAGSGLVLLGGSLTALTKPEIFASIIRMIINR